MPALVVSKAIAKTLVVGKTIHILTQPLPIVGLEIETISLISHSGNPIQEAGASLCLGIMSSIALTPTRVLTGVTIPDTPLLTKALDLAREHSSDLIFNHIMRGLLLGFVIADKLFPERDREAHAVAAILHDMGLPLGHPPHSELLSDDKRFEVDGANTACEFIKRQTAAAGVGAQWDRHRLQLVWDAIALHTTPSIAFEKEDEIKACAFGIWADFQGPDQVPHGLLTWDEYSPIVKVCHCWVF